MITQAVSKETKHYLHLDTIETPHVRCPECGRPATLVMFAACVHCHPMARAPIFGGFVVDGEHHDMDTGACENCGCLVAWDMFLVCRDCCPDPTDEQQEADRAASLARWERQQLRYQERRERWQAQKQGN